MATPKLYFREDIVNALRAAYVASEGTALLLTEVGPDSGLGGATQTELVEAYRRGFATALTTLGLAFGLDAAQSTGPAELGGDASANTQRQLPLRPSQVAVELVGFLWPAINRREP